MPSDNKLLHNTHYRLQVTKGGTSVRFIFEYCYGQTIDFLARLKEYDLSGYTDFTFDVKSFANVPGELVTVIIMALIYMKSQGITKVTVIARATQMQVIKQISHLKGMSITYKQAA